MTDPRPTLSDEDLAAVLDGTAEPSILDRLARDPAARARRDELAAAAAAVATPVEPLAPGAVDDLVARALAELPAAAAPTAPSPAPTDAVVTPLPPRSSRRPPPFWLVAAAVVVLVAIGLGLVWNGRQDRTDDTAATNDKAVATAEQDRADDDGAAAGAPATTVAGGAPNQSESEAAEPGEGPDQPTALADLPAPRDLGSFATKEELRAAVAPAVPTVDADLGAAGRRIPDPQAFERCAEQVRVLLSFDDPATSQNFAEVDEQPVEVFEFTAPAADDPSRTTTYVVAVGVDDCDPLFIVQR